MSHLRARVPSLLVLTLGLAACGVSVPGEWGDFVPRDNLTLAFGEENGEIKKIVLNYTREGMSGDQLRAKFTEKAGAKGFKMISECVAENGTSSAIYLSDAKEVFQVAISLLGDQFYDVGLDRAAGLPGVALANPETCKWTDAANAVCELDGDRCKFK
ncbi:MAG: hypothetical protein H6711_31240 [Myxococcales bacterium]|nr:hypothetical protein [Myxococcales bacterium]